MTISFEKNLFDIVATHTHTHTHTDIKCFVWCVYLLNEPLCHMMNVVSESKMRQKVLSFFFMWIFVIPLDETIQFESVVNGISVILGCHYFSFIFVLHNNARTHTQRKSTMKKSHKAISIVFKDSF